MAARRNAFSKADQALIGKKRLLPFYSRVRGREAREMVMLVLLWLTASILKRALKPTMVKRQIILISLMLVYTTLLVISDPSIPTLTKDAAA